MENAAEALKLAGFTLLFVAALSIAMVTIMQAKRTSEDVLSYSDNSRYLSNMEITDNGNFDNAGNRKVNVYDIIPTLYRYYQEKYIVLFYNGNSPLEIYKGSIKNANEVSDTESISYLNFELEDYKQAYWRGTTKDVKLHVDEVVNNLLTSYSRATFVETIYTTDNAYLNNSSDNNTSSLRKKVDEPIRVIKYTKNN